MVKDPVVDVQVHNEGTIFTFQPLTLAAQEWIEAYVGPDAQWFGSQLIVEHRYAAELAAAMQADGLTLR